MSKKKKKNVIAKRRAQAKAKKQINRKSNTHKTQRSNMNVQFIDRPAISEIDTPTGFRAISIGQAMIEYAKPIMDFVEKGSVKDQNDALKLSMHLWNYNITTKPPNCKISQRDIIKQIGKTLKTNSRESTKFFDMMLQRKKYLLPDEIQPDNAMTKFIRKEEHHLIPEFNYDSLNISAEPYLPDEEDEKLIQLINQMDNYIAEGVEYEEWEDHYFSMEEKSKERFKKWLNIKGAKQYSEDFPFHIVVYLNFIYRYMHNNNIILKTVLPIYIEEFFVDHVLRKVVVEPHEYIEWPPALKLFYNFLYEIGYIKNPEKITKLLDGIEPYFIEILRKRYS